MIFKQSQKFCYQFFFHQNMANFQPFLSESWVQIKNLSRVNFTENFCHFYFCQNMAILKVSKHLLKVVTEYKMQKRGHGFIKRLEILVCFLPNLQGMISTAMQVIHLQQVPTAGDCRWFRQSRFVIQSGLYYKKTFLSLKIRGL